MTHINIFYTSLISIFIMIIIGFILGRKKIINEQINKFLANLLLTIAMPCALFISFPDKYEAAAFQTFLQSILGGVIVIGTAIIISKILFGRKRLGKNFYQHQFAYVFNNASFLGYPLTLAVFGAESMIIYSGLMVVFNLALFSYGVWLFERKITPAHLRDIFLNPNILAVVIGFAFFYFSIVLPDALNQTITSLAALTTPLSLLCIGFMLSQITDWRFVWQKKNILLTCAMQLILMPLITFFSLGLFGFPSEIKQIFSLIQALPTATSLALFAEKYGGDKLEASEIVLISTLMSAITLPIVVGFILR